MALHLMSGIRAPWVTNLYADREQISYRDAITESGIVTKGFGLHLPSTARLEILKAPHSTRNSTGYQSPDKFEHHLQTQLQFNAEVVPIQKLSSLTT
jgi:hypothetical protein